MKKVLEDELMSLAHRILKLRNKADIHELKVEAAILYEKLAILSFAEKKFEGYKPTIHKHDVEKAIEKEYTEEQNDYSFPDGTEYNEDQIYEHNTEKIKDIVSHMPVESSQVDEIFNENKTITKHPLNDDPEEDFIKYGVHFDDLPDFEPSTDKNENFTSEKINKKEENQDFSTTTNNATPNKDIPQRTIDLFSQDKKSLNDSLNKDLKIGLNDRLSFVNNLFKGEVTVYEKFMQEINTLNSLEEAKSYLNDKIQSTYSFWKDKEDVANRLLHIIEKKFE